MNIFQLTILAAALGQIPAQELDLNVQLNYKDLSWTLGAFEKEARIKKETERLTRIILAQIAADRSQEITPELVSQIRTKIYGMITDMVDTLIKQKPEERGYGIMTFEEINFDQKDALKPLAYEYSTSPKREKGYNNNHLSAGRGVRRHRY